MILLVIVSCLFAGEEREGSEEWERVARRIPRGGLGVIIIIMMIVVLLILLTIINKGTHTMCIYIYIHM